MPNVLLDDTNLYVSPIADVFIKYRYKQSKSIYSYQGMDLNRMTENENPGLSGQGRPGSWNGNKILQI